VFVTHGGQPVVEEHVSRSGIALVKIDDVDDSGAVCRLIAEPGRDWAVIDGYHFDEAYLRRVRACGASVAVIDDQPRLEHYPVDLLIDPNIGALRQPYPVPASSRLLLGPRFTLLRPEFARVRRRTGVTPARAERLLITMGAADPADATSLVLRAIGHVSDRFDVTVVVGGANPRLKSIETLASRLPRVRVLHNPDGLEHLMNEADMAIAAVGGTIWELACLGVPTLLLSSGDVQNRVAEVAHRYGGHVWIGAIAVSSEQAIRDALIALSDDHAKRVNIVRLAEALIDGEGATRVATALCSPAATWSRRTAELRDAEAVWEISDSLETFSAFEHRFSKMLARTVIAERDESVGGATWCEDGDATPVIAIPPALEGGEAHQLLLSEGDERKVTRHEYH
jgi:UDP-2,4-diacetamido-2,4,6-trideoxy-beta-L-altropyranose hydrolase